jgi:hypothetical protein
MDDATHPVHQPDGVSPDQLLMLRYRVGLSFGWAETITHS